MPYANVDVNVHPQKVEVRFADPLAISDSITEAVQQSVALQQKGRKETESPFAYQEKDSSADALSEQAPQQMELEEKGQTDDRVPGFKEEDTQHIDYTKHTLWENEKQRPASFTFRLGSGAYELHEDASIMPVYTTPFDTTKKAASPVRNERRREESLGEHPIDWDSFLKPICWFSPDKYSILLISMPPMKKCSMSAPWRASAHRNFASQTLSPPIILTLSAEEQEMLTRYGEQIRLFGYEVEPFGGKEFAITAIPADFEAVDMKGMFLDMLDDFTNISGREAPELILEKVASMSCKAAIKGGDSISRAEAEQLIDELLSLENPYHCPHGRPTIISMSKYEIEKKFKRIV